MWELKRKKKSFRVGRGREEWEKGGNLSWLLKYGYDFVRKIWKVVAGGRCKWREGVRDGSYFWKKEFFWLK